LYSFFIFPNSSLIHIRTPLFISHSLYSSSVNFSISLLLQPLCSMRLFHNFHYYCFPYLFFADITASFCALSAIFAIYLVSVLCFYSSSYRFDLYFVHVFFMPF